MKILIVIVLILFGFFILSKNIFAFENIPPGVLSNYPISKERSIEIARNFIINTHLDKECDINKPKIINSKYWEKAWSVFFSALDKKARRNGVRWFVVRIDKKSGEIASQGWVPDL